MVAMKGKIQNCLAIKILFDYVLNRIMMLESYSPISIIVKLFGNGTVNGAQVPFNFQLLSMQRTSTAADYANAILYWMDNMPAGRSANWVVCIQRLMLYL